MNAAAVLVAAGKSSRMGGGRNKVLFSLDGNPVLSYSLRVFQAHSSVKQLVVVCRDEDMPEMSAIAATVCQDTEVRVVAGGAERFDSVRNGLEFLQDTAPDAVLIHDAARPFVEEAFITDSLRALDHSPGAVVGVPLKDTLKQVDHSALVLETADRSRFWLAQTPQTFRFPDILQAYRAIQPPPYPTDDGQVLELAGGRVTMVMGSYRNFKMTTPEDIQLAEAMIRVQ